MNNAFLLFHASSKTILFLKMVISIIGSGNAATVLGEVLKKNEHTIKEIAGRNAADVQNLAERLNANVCTDLATLDKNSDIYIIAVRDDAVAEVSRQLNFTEKIVAHTCGSVSIKVLANISANYGVLYPVQSLRKELNYLPSIPFLVDGNNAHTKENISSFANSISENVVQANDKTRLQYHLSAVIVSNFANHLFALAKEYCDRNKTDFNLLLPLIEETVHRLHYAAPALMQTGPAIRGDQTTMQKHLQLLDQFPQLKKIYETMSDDIAQFKK
jgi:predicted short-subunit dehydrogenase-like oxidoreductase (DUF2520 family)